MSERIIAIISLSVVALAVLVTIILVSADTTWWGEYGGWLTFMFLLGLASVAHAILNKKDWENKP